MTTSRHKQKATRANRIEAQVVQQETEAAHRAASEVHVAAMRRSEEQTAALLEAELQASRQWRSSAEDAERQAKFIEVQTKISSDAGEVARQRIARDQAKLSATVGQIRALEFEREELQRKSTS